MITIERVNTRTTFTLTEWPEDQWLTDGFGTEFQPDRVTVVETGGQTRAVVTGWGRNRRVMETYQPGDFGWLDDIIAETKPVTR